MNYLEKFSKLIHQKKDLLKCIFTTLLCQLIATSLVFTLIYTSKMSKKQGKDFELTHGLFFFFLGITLIMFMTSVQMSFTHRLTLFTLFSIIQGLFLGFALRYIRASEIMSALLFTILLFVTMLIFGSIIVYYQIDLSWLGIFLFFLLLGLIALRIVSTFSPYSKRREQFLSVFSLLLFSVYIIYDTNTILMRYNSIKYERDCILGALDYYLDTINIFVNSIGNE